jgi:arsenate reductase
MAEVLWRDLGDGTWEAHSAGTKPAGHVHPFALEALAGLQLPIDGLVSKDLTSFDGQSFDLVVTMCDSAHENCPTFPGVVDQQHWSFYDPAETEGSDDERRAVFRRVRDEISARICVYLSRSPA